MLAPIKVSPPLIVCKYKTIKITFQSILKCSTFRHHSTRSPSPVDYNDIQLRERNLKEEVQMLAYQRDSLISELQQLQEAKPILAQAYTVSFFKNYESFAKF